jgi:Na+-transporting methylmalonyl-CoA/oxaloacetate decarboxylase gamma subunit
MNVFLLATEPITGHPGFLENLAYQSVGIMVVLTSLSILLLCVTLLGRFSALPASAAVPSAAPASSSAVADSCPESSGLSPEVCAAITAAVCEVVGTDAAIQSIRPIPSAQPTNPFLQAWSVEGRRQIFHSHNFR